MLNYIDKCKQAAIAYVALGVAIVATTTIFIPNAHYRSGFIPLLAGIVVLLVLAWFIFKGVRWLIVILSFLAAARSGWWIYSFFTFADEESRWVYLLNALLNMAVITMLARAAASKSPEPDVSLQTN